MKGVPDLSIAQATLKRRSATSAGLALREELAGAVGRPVDLVVEGSGRITGTKMDEFLNRDQPAEPYGIVGDLRPARRPADNPDRDPHPDIGAIAVTGRGTQASISAS